MTKIINNIKDYFLRFKNASSETRYKMVLKGTSAFAVVLRYLVLVAIGYIVLYPLFYMISSSIRTGDSFYDPSIVWITSEVTLENFKLALKLMHYKDALINTVIHELIAAFIQLISCAFVAYGLARFEFKEKKILIGFMFMLIIVPSQMMMLPIVNTYKQLDVVGILGLINNWTGVDLRPNILGGVLTFYLPALFGVGIRAGIIIYIYLQFFKGLPKELEEAAWIDGAGPLRTFLRIALPSSGVVIMTVTVFSIIWHWNDYYLSSMYLYADKWPLAVRLGDLSSEDVLKTIGIQSYGAEFPQSIAIVMAGCLVFVVPVLIMYMILQKNFVKSIDRVGITG